MGKVRKVKTRTPSGVDTSADLEQALDSDAAGESAGCGPIEAICVHLQRSDVEDKLNGLHSFAVLALRKEKVREICGSELARIAAPLLCDKDSAIRNAAAGAFRNLSVFGTEVCDFLVENDILTALLTLIRSYDLTKNGFENELHADTFLQAIHVLRNLCESSPTATEAFNQANFLPSLLMGFDYRKFGLEVAISVAQLVLVVSENNTSSWNVLASSSILPELLAVPAESHAQLYLNALAAGILCNVPACSAAHTREILNSLDKLLTIDPQAQLLSCKTEIQNSKSKNEAPVLEISMETEEMAEAQSANQSKPNQCDADVTLKNLEHLLDAQRLVAEIITNLGSSDDQSNWGTDSEQSETESVADFDMEDEAADSGAGGLPANFLETIKENKVVEKLWQKAQPLDPALEKLLGDQEEIMEKVVKLRVSYLICLQNLCNVLAAEDLGGHSDVYNMWMTLGQQAFKGTEDVAILEAITSLMRSSLSLLKSHRDLFGQMTENDLNMIIEGASKCTDLNIRVNWNRMLGTLGSLLSEPLVKVIVQFLLTSCAKEEDLWVLSEGLDGLMDIFAVDDWPQIIAELEMCDRVQALEELFKSKLRQQRRELKERRATIYTVKTNFARFVSYLSKNCKQ
ncbi:uncharacterized protein LOC128266171 [Drosophila gunungcola]|uniref:SYO1-like TPR repeats domain-containing protein n=1 Tax=Drosophila gunungcola TaxID=103775 RepID=A0A9P9YZE4_9MUSC|nr:uncharacterized protein LOC128266171 [Drosophila gunungcola]KAI8045941.1 hypothetical protein M5D96_002132 [Drosophila gunungcola]